MTKRSLFTFDEELLEEERPPEVETSAVGQALAQEFTKLRAELYRTTKTVERMRFPATEILDFSGFQRELQALRTRLDAVQEQIQKEQQEDSYREVAMKFIGIVDAFDRFSEAATTAGENAEVKKWVDGFEGIAFMFRKSLEGYGVLPMNLVGKPFDPYLCLAVGTIEDATKADGLIVGEKRKGYHFKGRLLRPAEVIVVRSKPL